MASGNPSVEKVLLSPFEKHVKQALKLYAKPERLGAESPLARPYFLCNALASSQGPFESELLGNTLRTEIFAAAQLLWEGALPDSAEAMQESLKFIRQQPNSPQYAYIVLELRCFQQFLQPRRTSDIYEQDRFLPGSRSQHYRDFDVAVQKLALLLLERLRPALQLERPLPPDILIGYDAQIEQTQRAINNGTSISISGPGGAGKTSLGAHLVAQTHDRATFWYTLRPSLNDNLNTLLFALGHFLQGIGTTGLWQYVVASGGIPEDIGIATALLREDIGTLDPKPLFCFDELEYLYAPDPEHQTPTRVQVFELIESLQPICPMLLISQRPIFDTEQHLQLTGLSTPLICELWTRNGLTLDAVSGDRLYKFTAGNPRLLLLCLSLQKSSVSIDEMLESEGQLLTLLPIFNRLWKRLVAAERRLLQRLSVFRSTAPEDAWDDELVAALVERRLIERDGRGGVMLLPALREIVVGELSVEREELLHLEAAQICAERAEYTAAAYHFWRGAQPQKAVQLWYPHRLFELRRGHGTIALMVFDNISRNSIKKSERKVLDLIRAELHQRAGHLQEGLSNLEHQDWQAQSEVAIQALQLKGELQEALGYPDAALESYGQAASITTRLLSRMIGLHQRRGILHLRQKDLQYSHTEVKKAEIELNILRGMLAEEEGQYANAMATYGTALQVSEQLNDKVSMAVAQRSIAALYGRQQKLEQAVVHANQSISLYESLGDRLNLEKMRSNLAFIYVQAGQFSAAVEAAQKAYTFFLTASDPYYAATTGANLAEAYFELGQLESAESVALEVLNLEERQAHPYVHFTLGQVRRSQENLEAAHAHFNESLQTARMNGDLFMEAYALRASGEVLMVLAQPDEGKSQLKQALNLFQQMDIEGEIAATELLLDG